MVVTEEILITRENPRSEDAQLMMEELSQCLNQITGDSGINSFNVEDVCHKRAVFAIARDKNGFPVGCGAFRPFENEKAAEIKRMYARKKASGVGSRLLAFLEEEARQMGYTCLRLETRRINTGAVNFYLRHGYKIIPNYGKYIYNEKAVCFEKQLELER